MANSPTPIAVGLYGLGDHARRTILPAIDSSDSVHLAGIATRDQSVLDVEAERWQCRACATPHGTECRRGLRPLQPPERADPRPV